MLLLFSHKDEHGTILNDKVCDGRCHCVYAACSSDDVILRATSCAENKSVLCGKIY